MPFCFLLPVSSVGAFMPCGQALVWGWAHSIRTLQRQMGEQPPSVFGPFRNVTSFFRCWFFCSLHCTPFCIPSFFSGHVVRHVANVRLAYCMYVRMQFMVKCCIFTKCNLSVYRISSCVIQPKTESKNQCQCANTV